MYVTAATQQQTHNLADYLFDLSSTVLSHSPIKTKYEYIAFMNMPMPYAPASHEYRTSCT